MTFWFVLVTIGALCSLASLVCMFIVHKNVVERFAGVVRAIKALNKVTDDHIAVTKEMGSIVSGAYAATSEIRNSERIQEARLTSIEARTAGLITKLRWHNDIVMEAIDSLKTPEPESTKVDVVFLQRGGEVEAKPVPVEGVVEVDKN